MKHFKKIFILSFVICLCSCLAMPKVFAISEFNTNTDIIDINYNSVNEEYGKEQNNNVQSRQMSNNQRGNQGIKDFTTWVGIVLLSVIVLVAIRTLPLEKRL